MTDLSQVSTEELTRLAGLSSSDLSDVSDAELLAIAGVEKPRQPGEPGITATKPSFLEQVASPLIGTPGDRTLLGRAIYGEEATPQGPDYGRGMDLPLVKLEEFIPGGTVPTEFARGVLSAGSELTTPTNAALLTGVGAATQIGGKVLARLISGGFAADMTHALYQQGGEFKRAVDAGDLEGAANVAGQMTATGAFAGLAARHATQGIGKALKETGTRRRREPSPAPGDSVPSAALPEPVMQGVPTEELIRIVATETRLRPGEVPFSETVPPPESPAVIFGERPARFAPIPGPDSRVEIPALKPADAALKSETVQRAEISPKPTEAIVEPKPDLSSVPTETLLKVAGETPKREFRLGVVGEPDVLNAADAIGKLRPRTKTADPANYDGWDEVMPHGETRLLVGKEGLAPDDFRQRLSEAGYHFETTSEMYEAFQRAKESRQALRAKLADDRAAASFAKAAFEPGKRQAQPLDASSIVVGSEFQLKGEKFRVTAIDEDGTVTVEDGRKFGTQELSNSEVIFPDRGTVKVPEIDTSFEFAEPPAVTSIADLSRTLADASRKAQGEAANEIVGQLGMKAAGPFKKAGSLEGSPLFPEEEKQTGLFGEQKERGYPYEEVAGKQAREVSEGEASQRFEDFRRYRKAGDAFDQTPSLTPVSINQVADRIRRDGKWIGFVVDSRSPLAQVQTFHKDALVELNSLENLHSAGSLRFMGLPDGSRVSFYEADPQRTRTPELGASVNEREFRQVSTSDSVKYPFVKKGTRRRESATSEAPGAPLAKQVAEEKPTGAFGGGSLADKGGYAERPRAAIELPEIVELARDINKGKYPIVKERLRNALGRFRYQGEEGNILLRADIFLGESIGLKSVKPQDAKAAVDEFRKAILQSSNLPEDKLAIRQEYNRRTGLVDLKAYRKDPTLAPKVLAHEVGHLVDWLPDKDLARGNILGRIATLKKYLKTLLDEIPTDPSKVITPKERAKARARIAAEVKREAHGATKEEIASEVSTRYHEWLEEEIGNRNLITRDDVMNELKAVSQEWKPFEEAADPDYTRYRYSSKELYADAVSVLVNEPSMLKDQAPTFWKSFMSYLDGKPEVKSLYDSIQDRVGNRTEVTEVRLENVYDMMQRGNAARQRLNERNAPKAEELKDSVMKWLVDRQHAALKVIRGQERQGGTVREQARKARYDLEEINYLTSEAENYIHEVEARIRRPMEQAGLSDDDIGAYLFLERARQERTEIANPLGHTRETAVETLQGLKTRLGEEKFAELEGLVQDYRNLREDLILPRLEASRMFKPELMKLIKSNKAYARFSVQKHLEDAYGSGTTARIFKQIGTLSEIENPLVATVLQDISMLRAAKINQAKSSLAQVLRGEPGLLEPAEMRYSLDVRGQVPKDPKDPRQGLFTLMVDGKPEHFYVSKAIAQSFERTPFEATKVAQIISALNRPIRDLLVSKNPLWMARNVFRDIRATVKNLPEVGLTDVSSLGRAYKQAFGEAWRDVMRGERSEDISQMMRGRMLTPDRVFSSKEQTFETELDRLATGFQVNCVEHLQAVGARGKLKQAYAFLDKLGRVSEITGKIAGYKLLKGSDRTPEETGHVVRTRVGTPDYKRVGEAQAVTNNVFLFSNVNKEGLRSAWESFNEDRGGYVWKTVATNILPKVLLAAGAAGVGGDLLKRIIEGIPNYDKRMYSVIPIGLNPQGKSIYLRIPEDYEGQFWGGLAWELMQGRVTGKEGAISLAAEQTPYRLHPALEVGSDLFHYYVRGLNPLDEYRGRSVLPEQVFRAGGAEAQKSLAKYAWRNLGGTVLYNPSGNQLVTNESALEKVLKTFPLNTLGTFLKISDQGISERLEDVHAEVSQRRARRVVDVQERIRESIKSTGGKPTARGAMQLFMDLRKASALQPSTTLREFTAGYLRQAGKSSGNPYVEAIARALTNDERVVLLQHYKQTLSSARFDELVTLIQREGVLSPRSYTSVMRRMQERTPRAAAAR